MRVAFRLDRCLGLNAAVAPHRLRCDAASGEYELAKAVNVDIDATGAVSRRTGFVRLAGGNVHSLWSDGAEAYAVMGGDLCRVGADGSAAVVRAGLTEGARMAYLRVDDRVFYANGLEKGILRSGNHEDWGGRPYPGPAFTVAYGDPPAGRLLEYYGGRIYMAVGETVYFTCAVGLFHWVDLAAGYLPPLDGDIRMLRAVDDGLYIGTQRGVVFAAGAGPEEFAYRLVCRAAPVEGTDALFPEGGRGKAAGKDFQGKALAWIGEDGVYLGQGSGAVTRLKALPPFAGSRGCALAGQSKYVALIEP